ncbi:MAG: PAS domain-containing protein [Polyangiaceae bacterium]|nr:PAS domain-containing protein [Polyangiaceae bacterium]
MTLGLRSKLTLISIGLITLTLLVGYAYLRTELEGALVAGLRDDLEVRARLVASEAAGRRLETSSPAAWDALADELASRASARVMLADRDGRVLGSSELDDAGVARHPSVRGRAEVRDALVLGRGSAVDTDAPTRQLRVAVAFGTGAGSAIAIVALPLDQVDSTLARVQQGLWAAALIALGVAVVMSSLAARLSFRSARQLVEAARRLAEGDLSARSGQRSSDELGELGRSLDRLARTLSTKVDEVGHDSARLAGILSAMQEGVLVVDRAGRVVLINPALREMMLVGNDAVGKTLLEVLRHADLKEALDEARASGESVSTELEMAGIKPRRLLVRAAALPGASGDVFAMFVDVTEVRRLESLRRDFVANVSHELRTPVTAIRSAAETLQLVAGRDPRALTQFVDMIERNARRMHDLVEDLLDLSRIESRELHLSVEPLEIAAAFTHTASLFEERATKKQIRLVVEPIAERALADRRALEHVLSNLVDNAVKYCGPGSEIRLAATPLDERTLRLSVSDTGPGIEAQHLPRLFERFYRVDAGRSREVGGTGLGLAIVKHLVEAMRGTVSVDSAPGSGTTFGFTLPRSG